MTFLCFENEGVAGNNDSIFSHFLYLPSMKSNKAAGNSLRFISLNVCLLKELNMLKCREYKIT